MSSRLQHEIYYKWLKTRYVWAAGNNMKIISGQQLGIYEQQMQHKKLGNN